jgi:hypothetical protein
MVILTPITPRDRRGYITLHTLASVIYNFTYHTIFFNLFGHHQAIYVSYRWTATVVFGRIPHTCQFKAQYDNIPTTPSQSSWYVACRGLKQGVQQWKRHTVQGPYRLKPWLDVYYLILNSSLFMPISWPPDNMYHNCYQCKLPTLNQ